MAKPDPLVRWETAALRESAARRGAATDAPSPVAERSHRKDAWVTLRDAHYETGLPVETLRKWARRKHVPSELRTTEFGERRMLDLAAVEARARRLGRPLRPIPPEAREHEMPPVPPAAPETEPAPAADAAAVVDLREPEEAAPTAPPPAAVEPPQQPGHADPTDGAPPGTMIVPIAAWDRMLMQLGNLHEAGQQLADARERAAKAETEATFLRERLAELRERLEASKPADPSATDAAESAGSPTAPAPEPRDPVHGEKLWQYVVRGWRARRSK